MTETLQEYVNARGVQMRVDRENGVIRGVKILGLQSRNGRVYLPDALFETAACAAASVPVEGTQSEPVPPLREATVEDLRRERPDLVECVLEEQAGELKQLREEVDELRDAEAARQKCLVARRLSERRLW